MRLATKARWLRAGWCEGSRHWDSQAGGGVPPRGRSDSPQQGASWAAASAAAVRDSNRNAQPLIPSTICGTRSALADHKPWKQLTPWTHRRETLPDTYRAIAGLVSDRAAHGEPRVRRGQPGERGGERSARPVRRSANESPAHQADHHALFSERKVLQPALVTVVDPVREAAVVRTCGAASCYPSTLPNVTVTASTSSSSILSNTSESQNGASVRMTRTITGHGQPEERTECT